MLNSDPTSIPILRNSLFFLILLLIFNQILELSSYLLSHSNYIPLLFQSSISFLLAMLGLYCLKMPKPDKFLQPLHILAIIVMFETSLILTSTDRPMLYFLKGALTYGFFESFNDFIYRFDRFSLAIFLIAGGYIFIRPVILTGCLGFFISLMFIVISIKTIFKRKILKKGLSLKKKLIQHKKIENCFYQNILESMNCGILVFNEKGKNLFSNSTFQKIIGFGSNMNDLKCELGKFGIFEDFFGNLKKTLNLKIRNPKSFSKFYHNINNFQRSQTHIFGSYIALNIPNINTNNIANSALLHSNNQQINNSLKTPIFVNNAPINITPPSYHPSSLNNPSNNNQAFDLISLPRNPSSMINSKQVSENLDYNEKSNPESQTLDNYIEKYFISKKPGNGMYSFEDVIGHSANFQNKFRVKLKKNNKKCLANYYNPITSIKTFIDKFLGNTKPTLKTNDTIKGTMVDKASYLSKKESIDDNVDNSGPNNICTEKIKVIKKFYIKRKDEDFCYSVTFMKSEETHLYIMTISEIIEANETKDLIVELKETQSKIIASLAHELRTPLNGMGSLIENLKELVNRDQYENTLFPLISTHNNLNLIVNDYLDFSKIYLGNFQLNFGLFDLKETIYKIVNFVRSAMHIENLAIQIEIEEKVQGIVRNDQMRLNQILYNLLANALKYTKEGSIKIKASLLDYLSPLTIIQISVEDTGCGIKKSTLNRLGTLHPSVNMKLAGIGLTISNYIAKKLAPGNLGGIYVSSEEGIGSKFFFLIENMSNDDVKSETSSIISNMKKSSGIEPIAEVLSAESSPIFKSFSKTKNNKIFNFPPQTIEEEDEKSRSNQIFFSGPSISNSNIDLQANEPIHLPTVTLQYLEQLTFKNKFDKYEARSTKTFPKIFTFDNSLNKMNSSGINMKVESMNILKTPPVDGKSGFLTLESCGGNKKSFSSNQLDSNTDLKATGDLNYSMRDSSSTEEKLELLQKKIETKKCHCPDILLVDDTFYNIKAFELIASNLPFKLNMDSVNSGDLAIEKIKNFYESSQCPSELKCYTYKCIFMDYEMPKKTGVQTAKEIMEYFRLKNYSTWIIPWTAFDDKGSKLECKEAGMVDYLSKPFNASQLKKILVKRMLPQFI